MNQYGKKDEREALRRDPVRLRLKELLRINDLTLAAVSLSIGRNQSYLQQYVDRGVPAVLGYRDSETLAELLGCDPEELRHETVPKRKPMKRKRPRSLPGLPGAPVVAVPEITSEGAVAEALTGERAPELEIWGWPLNIIRYESGAALENLRIIRVRGNSMEPEMFEGDRILVDASNKLPVTGEKYLLWDGNGLVVKRVEVVHRDAADGDEPTRLRLISANSDYAPYSCLARDVHVFGKVWWVVGRVAHG